MKKFPYFYTFFTLILFSLCVSVGYLISTYIVSANLFQATTKVETPQTSYFLLSIFQDNSKENCVKVQKGFQDKNCAGYIYEENGKFYIIASIYDNINDAELVKSNLENNGYSIEILNYSTENLTFEGNFSNKEQEIIKNCLQIRGKTYKDLYDVSISLDTNVCDELTCRLKINEIYSTFLTTKNNFETLFFEQNNVTISKIREIFENIENELKFLTETKENLSSQIKLAYCNIILS